jgi:hypothetical protein
MKSSYFLPAATALAGFAIAWIAKPVPPPLVVKGNAEETSPARSARSTTGGRDIADDGKRPKEVKAGDFPLADQAEQGPKTRDEARLLRLTEALGLSIDQQGAIISLIEDVQAKADGNVPVIQDLTTRGNAIEEALAKILSPEQLAKFQELRVRERENRVEVRAQRLLTTALEDIDLSPEQREEVLDRLRQKAKADMQSIPAAATLLLDKSMLPTNNLELSVDGVLLLAQMGGENPPEDPAEAHRQVLETQRRELEEILRCYDGILTAGQMGQYQAVFHEQREAMKRVTAPGTGGKAAAPPAPEPPAQIIIEPDDEEEDGQPSDFEEETPAPPRRGNLLEE